MGNNNNNNKFVVGLCCSPFARLATLIPFKIVYCSVGQRLAGMVMCQCCRQQHLGNRLQVTWEVFVGKVFVDGQHPPRWLGLKVVGWAFYLEDLITFDH